jgi:hypothetical protein
MLRVVAMFHNGKLHELMLKMTVKHMPSFVANLERLTIKYCYVQNSDRLPC